MKVLAREEMKRRCYEAILNLSKVLGKDIEVVLRELEVMVDPDAKESMLQAKLHAEAEETANRLGYRSVREMNLASQDQIQERSILAGDYGLDYKKEYLENKRRQALEKERQDQIAKKKLAEIKLKAMKEKEERQKQMMQQLKSQETVANEAAQAIQKLTGSPQAPKATRQAGQKPAAPAPKYKTKVVEATPILKEEIRDEEDRFQEFMDNVRKTREGNEQYKNNGGPDWLRD